jgi:hypothetical protein
MTMASEVHIHSNLESNAIWCFLDNPQPTYKTSIPTSKTLVPKATISNST